MKIEFNKVILHNFLSFGDATLNINDDGFIRVSGINENPDDMAVSNGSGKSSLWEAVVWALTGETIRGTKQISNIYGTDGTYVKLSFKVDNTQYDILRSKDSKEYKTNLLIYIDGVDKSGKGIRESEKLLQQFLPDITASLLGSVIILGQGLPQKFTNNSPSGRKEVLEQLSKSDFMIQDLKDRVAKRKNELNSSIRKLQDEVVGEKAKKNMLEESISKNTQSVESMDRKLLDEEHRQLDFNLQTLTSQLDNQDTEIVNITKSLIEKQDELSKLKLEKVAEISTIQTKHSELVADLKIQFNSIKTPIDAKSKEIIARKNVKDICPTCGQKLPGVVKLDTTELEKEVEELKKQLEVIQLNIKEQDNVYSDNIRILEEKYNPKITKLELDVQNTNNHIRTLQSEFSKTKIQKETVEKQLQQVSNELYEFETILKSLLDIIDQNKKTVTELDSKILYNNKEIEKLQQHLDVQNKFDTALKRDFRGYLLLSVIEYIQSRAKNYCKTIFDTDKIGFELDGNNIDITYCNKPYENLSGGEKQKVDLIVQFSIRDMLCSHLDFTSNILVLDEVFDGLDAIGCQKVLDVISSITDIRNIFIVTHRKDLSIPTDKELVVVKSSSGISEIR